MQTRTRLSPGRAFHKHIKGQYVDDVLVSGCESNGYVALPVDGQDPSNALATCTNVRHSPVRNSSWIVATTYGSGAPHMNDGQGTLIVWTTKNGMVYINVPAWKVGALHGFETMEEVREYTTEEMIDLLKRSLA